MKLSFSFNNASWTADTQQGVSLAVPLDFDGPQPNCFGAPTAQKQALEMEGFIGDTTRGGSCNVDSIQIVPHCNGTHTESVGHIVNEDIPAPSGLQSLMTAALVTVDAFSGKQAAEDGESYRPELEPTDKVVSKKNLAESFQRLNCTGTDAIIIRTHHDPNKKAVTWNQENAPAFLTTQAMEWIVAQSFQHLLLDLPSVDRMNDDGLLTNHRLFWNVAAGSREMGERKVPSNTITEMIFAPATATDGLYLLNLQVPVMKTDAVPSNPVIYPLQKAN